MNRTTTNRTAGNLLTYDRAANDNIPPARLRLVADSNQRIGERTGDRRLLAQAENLRAVAGRLEAGE